MERYELFSRPESAFQVLWGIAARERPLDRDKLGLGDKLSPTHCRASLGREGVPGVALELDKRVAPLQEGTFHRRRRLLQLAIDSPRCGVRVPDVAWLLRGAIAANLLFRLHWTPSQHSLPRLPVLTITRRSSP